MSDPFFTPVSGFELHRFAGVPTFMRLPHVPPEHPRFEEVEIGLVGAPWDAGTTNRPGPRHGPRQVRDASTMIRAEHPLTGVRPFERARCADLGDIGPNPASVPDTLSRFTSFYKHLKNSGVRPVTVGGDHLCSLPVLRGLASDEPLGMIHFDSHTDLFHSYFGGEMYTHGTPFRRAVEEGLLEPKRVVQIGIRGTMYDREDLDFAKANGIRVIGIDEFFDRGVGEVMAEARDIVGLEPCYISYDIDFVDPAFAPGTGTPEVGGPSSYQAVQVCRYLNGLDIRGADLVEVSPPFDTTGGTAFLAASILFEMLAAITA